MYKDKSNIIFRRRIIIGVISVALIALFIAVAASGTFADEGPFYLLWIVGGLIFIFYRSWSYVLIPSSVQIGDSSVTITKNPHPINNPKGEKYVITWEQIQSVELTSFSDNSKDLAFSVLVGDKTGKIHVNFSNLEGQEELLKDIERHHKEPIIHSQKDLKEQMRKVLDEAKKKEDK